MRYLILHLAFIVLMGFCSKLSATIVSDSFEIIFKPVSVETLMVFDSGAVVKEGGVFYEANHAASSTGGRLFIFGAIIPSSFGTLTNIAWRIVGENNAEYATPLKLIEKNKLIEDYPEGIKRNIISRKSELQALNLELNREVFNLKRLRVEAGRKADLGKIIQLEEEARSIEDSISAISRDVENLKDSLEIVKEMKEPARFEKRRVTLTEQLSDLARAALDAEQSASSRKHSSQLQLEENLTIIDATRFDDLEELEAEYLSLTGKEFKAEGEPRDSETPDAATNYLSSEGL